MGVRTRAFAVWFLLVPPDARALLGLRSLQFV